MDAIIARIEQLTYRIQQLEAQQAGVSRELQDMKAQLEALTKQVINEQAFTSPPPVVPATTVQPIVEVNDNLVVPERVLPAAIKDVQATVVAPPVAGPVEIPPAAPVSRNTSFEEFIGKNLASKVGILITIVGIFIGAKYAIEHNMVSPVVRIINGYISGLVLAGIAWRLKQKYPGYSAVLMGGGLSVLYFITYTAYAFYQLLPQLAAFGLMLVITAVIIYAALLYNRSVIAHLAQVGAYAIPFLLSDNSGRFSILFVYITIINAGILIVSFRKYWKSLFYVAYSVTWLIFLVWTLTDYRAEHQALAWTFAGLFFVEFYATALAYKLVRRQQYIIGDVILLLTNAFLFYGIGIGLLKDTAAGEKWLGLFTAANALLHFGVSLLLRRLGLADKALQLLVGGLALVFLTIAIPVQFEGNWITLLWLAEAALLLTVSRRWQRPVFEQFGALLLCLSVVSLLMDWTQYLIAVTNGKGGELPFRNIVFFSGLLIMAAFGYMIRVNLRNPLPVVNWQEEKAQALMTRLMYSNFLPFLLVATGYIVVVLEIVNAFSRLRAQLRGADGSFGLWGKEVDPFLFIVLLLHAMAYMILLLLVNARWFRKRPLAIAGLLCTAVICWVLLLAGLPQLNDMTAYYFERNGAGLYFGRTNWLIRYAVLGLLILMCWAGSGAIKNYFREPMLRNAWWLLLCGMGLGYASAEYICWMRVSGAVDQYRFGLSIIWGVFALGLISYGIWKKRRYLRLAAMVLFTITLLKLFFYDLAGSSTIIKTVSFISLGVILLLVSYLYNRYKELLFGEDEKLGS
ncbi:MAG: DUF2339 domain-containing protein [Candidatus Pseudobacter hemicellulosilyticus]|uniref:DUF2339 domain-containing protein n=1 Tax=Candidatus Pseudobacter hemicellulosilyticus TaxID=3121375 RepID=A0AAJ6BGX9_9BACT|nr:MAG: DUF2339 domain-containing protein [Pseudobacter sp.]